MLVLVIASIIIQSQHGVRGIDCSKYTGPYTPTYTKHGLSNANSFYFVPNTYAAGGTKGECDPLNGDNRKFSAITDKNPCIGQWCVPKSTPRRENGWGCPDHTVDCYHVEHIIPLNGEVAGLDGCERDIFGNAIEAYGRWNIECGNGHECEKREIYKEIYIRAYDAVARCCKRPIPPPSNDSTSASVIIGIATTLAFLGIFACIALTIRERVQNLGLAEPEPDIDLIAVSNIYASGANDVGLGSSIFRPVGEHRVRPLQTEGQNDDSSGTSETEETVSSNAETTETLLANTSADSSTQ